MSDREESNTQGVKRQAQELIEQAYQRGYKAGYSKAENDYYDKMKDDYTKLKDEKRSSYELGLNMAWEAAKYCVNADEARQYNYVFDGCIAKEIFKDYTASEAISKIKAYEQKKQEEDKEIKVGDEVTYTFANGASVKPFVVLKISCLDDGGRYYEGFEISDMRWVSGGLDYKKTGRTFPQIAEFLKKLQEDKE